MRYLRNVESLSSSFVRPKPANGTFRHSLSNVTSSQVLLKLIESLRIGQAPKTLSLDESELPISKYQTPESYKFEP